MFHILNVHFIKWVSRLSACDRADILDIRTVLWISGKCGPKKKKKKDHFSFNLKANIIQKALKPLRHFKRWTTLFKTNGSFWFLFLMMNLGSHFWFFFLFKLCNAVHWIIFISWVMFFFEFRMWNSRWQNIQTFLPRVKSKDWNHSHVGTVKPANLT